MHQPFHFYSFVFLAYYISHKRLYHYNAFALWLFSVKLDFTFVFLLFYLIFVNMVCERSFKYLYICDSHCIMWIVFIWKTAEYSLECPILLIFCFIKMSYGSISYISIQLNIWRLMLADPVMYVVGLVLLLPSLCLSFTTIYTTACVIAHSVLFIYTRRQKYFSNTLITGHPKLCCSTLS